MPKRNFFPLFFLTLERSNCNSDFVRHCSSASQYCPWNVSSKMAWPHGDLMA